MLHLIDDALESFLRAEIGGGSQFDVAFDLPDKEWEGALTRPTLNLYLAKVDPGPPEANSGVEFVEQEGVLKRRLVLPRIAFTYYATAWVSEVRDEHRLLGAVLGVVARKRTIGLEHLPEPLHDNGPLPTVGLDKTVPQPGELWPAIGGRCHPALAIVLTASVDTGRAEELARRPEEMSVGVVDQRQPARRDERRHRPLAGAEL